MSVREHDLANDGAQLQHQQSSENTQWSETLAQTYGENQTAAADPRALAPATFEAPRGLPKGGIESDGSINFWDSPFPQTPGRPAPVPESPDQDTPDKPGPEKPVPPTEPENPKDGPEKPAHEGPGDKDDTPPIPPAYQHLADEQQLDVRAVVKDGHTEYVYSTTIDGVRRDVLQTEKPPEAAKEQLHDAQEAMIKDLEKTYNINIARTGETVKTEDGKDDVPVNTPTLGELQALKEALVRSAPDTQTTNGKPLRVVILDPGQSLGKGIGGYAIEGQIALTSQPKDNLSYLKEVGIHELAHVGQFERYAQEGTGKYAAELGWVKAGDNYALKAKDGTLWVHDDRNDTWMRVDKDGNPSDENGKRVDNPWDPSDHGEDSPRVQRKTANEMREAAVVKPYSTYFTNPNEMGAAMITPFRDGRELREKLYHESLETYELAKKLDQDQINAECGTQPDGQPKMIRSPDGILVENTAENRLEIQQFEAGFR